MIRAAVLHAPSLAAACAGLAACASSDDAVLRERRANAAFVDANAALLDGKHGGEAVAVQRGALAASARTESEAARLAEEKDPGAAHRFVFRPARRGDRMLRTAWLPQGGVAVGRGFLEDLGFRVRASAPGTLSLDGPGGRKTLDLARDPLVRVVVRTLDGRRTVEVAAAVDRDFDGGLLLAPEHGAALGVVRWETPGRAEVQIALGRPFDARRAIVLAEVPALGAAAAPVEALVPDVFR